MTAGRAEPKLAISSRFRAHLNDLPREIGVNWYSTPRECLDAVRDADALWIGMGTPSKLVREQIEHVVEAGTRLRWIHSHGAGTESHPLDLYRKRGLIFTNGSGISSIPIAEHVVMVMLAAARKLPIYMQAQHRSEWLSQGPTPNELFDSQALILGFGAIGRAIGDRLKPFGVRVVGVRRRPDGEPNVIGPDEWRSRLPESDWVIVSVILTPETRHLVGSRELAAMRSSAWLINISRGAVVEEQALVASLQSADIGGACLDVTDPEPPSRESPLWGLTNVIITPHSSWSSRNFDSRAASLFLRLLEQFRDGAQLQNTIDLGAGHRDT